MAYTAVVWNLEEFGARLGTFSEQGNLEHIRCLLIVNLMTATDADVVVIQELRFDGILLLKKLGRLLGSSSHFDWLPGAQVSSGQLADYSQLGFVPSANSEGYGVVWYSNALDPLQDSLMSAGLDTLDTIKASKKRKHYIELSAEGKKLKFDKPTTVPIYFDTASKSEAVGFPHSTCPQAFDNSKWLRTRTTETTNDTIQQEVGSRRPCLVQMHVSNSRTVPLVVYHAPVGANSSRSYIYGTLIGCSVDPLQVADCVYAGDFNVVSDTYQEMLSTYMPSIGYNKVAFNQSMVHVFKRGGGFRTGQEVYGSARDVAFIKAPKGTEPTPITSDALSDDIISQTGGMRATFLDKTNMATLKKAIFPALLAEKKKGWTQQVVDVANAYLAGNTGNNFPHGADQYTAAAIMYTTFVSDHLPLLIQYK